MYLRLIRHTRPHVEPGICYGQSDLDVCESFEEEVLEVLRNLPTTVELVYASPLKRCSALATKIAEARNLPLVFDERLKELNFGEWEMKNWNEIPSDELKIWMDSFVSERCPGGESYMDLQQRVHEFFTEVKARPHQHIAIITHAGVIKLLHAIVLELEALQAMKMKIGYGEIFLIKTD